jgi:hypothetical protein
VTISQQRVSEILRKDWDPIGLGDDGPKDEYDSYVPQVHEILTNEPSVDGAVSQIASYLTWVRIRQMGLSHIDGCRKDARAAVLLVDAR